MLRARERCEASRAAGGYTIAFCQQVMAQVPAIRPGAGAEAQVRQFPLEAYLAHVMPQPGAHSYPGALIVGFALLTPLLLSKISAGLADDGCLPRAALSPHQALYTAHQR